MLNEEMKQHIPYRTEKLTFSNGSNKILSLQMAHNPSSTGQGEK
jgi:hypothetical protein